MEIDAASVTLSFGDMKSAKLSMKSIKGRSLSNMIRNSLNNVIRISY